MSYVLTITSFDVNGVRRVTSKAIETPIGSYDLLGFGDELDESLFFAMGSLDPFMWGYSNYPSDGRSDPKRFHNVMDALEIIQGLRKLPIWVDRRGDNLLVP